MKKDEFRVKRSIRKPIFAACLLLTVPFVLSGCRKETAAEPSVSVSESETAGPEDETEEINWNELTMTAEGSSDQMIEAGGYLFFSYENTIYCMNEKSGERRELLSLTEEERNPAFWVYRGGLYFSSRQQENPADGSTDEFYGLYRLELSDGTKEHLADLKIRPSALYASEDKLYVKGFDSMNIVYELDENGRTKGELSPAETIYGKIPDGCFEIFSGMLPYYAEHCGYLPVQNAEHLVIADINGGNLREITEISNTSSVLFARDCFFALFRDGNGQTQCWRYEAETLDKTLIFESETNPNLLQFADGKLYFEESKTPNLVGSEINFYQVAAEEKRALSNVEQVFSVKEEPGMTGSYHYYGNFYVTEDAIYGQQFKDYGIYIGKADKKSGQTELLSPVLYQSPLQVLGHVEGTSEELLCECGNVTAAQIYVEYLVFDGEGEAVQKMNQAMEEKKSQVEEAAKEAVSYMEEEEIHWMAENLQPYSETFVIDGNDSISYLSEDYVCIRMDGYEYSGGAHGFPYRDYFIFDRKNGNRLTLADIVSSPVEDLQKLVGAAFRTLAEETNFSFEAPEDLEFTVADSVSYDSNFYLTEEGIGFYYYPYEIAPYAAGFPEAVIPYEKMELKIDIAQ